MTRALYALRLWRWWPANWRTMSHGHPSAWTDQQRRRYDPYGDMDWRTAWAVAGLVCDA